MTIRIVTDSTCDLPDELIAQHGITVIPLYINFGDKGYLDQVELSRSEFYTNLPDYPVHPTTAAPGSDAFRNTYERLAQEGASEILSIHISKRLSATPEVAQVGAKQAQGVAVTVLDSGQLSLGTGFAVLAAAKAAAQGHSMAEILSTLNEQISRTHVFAALDTMEFLRRSGRMSGIVTGLGSLLQLKPIMKMYAGKATSEMVRTTRQARQRVIELLKEKLPLEQVALVHTHASEAAQELREMAKDLLPTKELLSMDITPVIGAHIGPGAVGFAVVSQRSAE